MTTGLSRSESPLLGALADGPKLPHQLFLASQRREEAPFEGDAWAWRRLYGLQPLVSLLPLHLTRENAWRWDPLNRCCVAPR